MNELHEAMREQPQFQCGKPTAFSVIEQYEEALGLRFSDDYRAFLKEFGYAGWDGCSIYGVHPLETNDVLVLAAKAASGEHSPIRPYCVAISCEHDLRCHPASDAGRVYPRLPRNRTFETFDDYVIAHLHKPKRAGRRA